MKLSPKQCEHLLALKNGPRGSYPGLHMGVLNSLALKGLVSATHGVGSIAMPHTAIKWKLTDAGEGILHALAGTR